MIPAGMGAASTSAARVAADVAPEPVVLGGLAVVIVAVVGLVALGVFGIVVLVRRRKKK